MSETRDGEATTSEQWVLDDQCPSGLPGFHELRAEAQDVHGLACNARDGGPDHRTVILHPRHARRRRPGDGARRTRLDRRPRVGAGSGLPPLVSPPREQTMSASALPPNGPSRAQARARVPAPCQPRCLGLVDRTGVIWSNRSKCAACGTMGADIVARGDIPFMRSAKDVS